MAIRTKSRNDLKSFFVKNAIPTQSNFAELVDSQLNQADDGVFKLQDEPLSVVSAPGDLKRSLRLYSIYPSPDPDWMICLNPRDPEDGKPREGFGITDDKGTARVFVNSDGAVGVGTTKPEAKLDIRGSVKLKAGPAIEEFSTDHTFVESSDSVVPTKKAVKDYIDELLVGSISAFAMKEPPAGWVECDGRTLKRDEYVRLFARIGITFGEGDGATTFNVPDLRGEFVRGWDHGRTVDPGRELGVAQVDQLHTHVHGMDHNHAYVDCYFAEAWGWIGVNGAAGTQAPMDYDNRGFYDNRTTNGTRGYTDDPTQSPTGAETRPRNIALLYCIKY